MTFWDRGRRALGVVVLILVWILQAESAVFAGSAFHGAPSLAGKSATVADGLLVMLLAYCGVCAVIALFGRIEERRFPRLAKLLRWPVPAVAGVLVGVNLVLSLVAGALSAPGQEASIGPGMLVSLLCPGVPLTVLAFLRWTSHVPWRLPGTGPRTPGARVPHAPLPPFPQPGSRPVPGQVWEVTYPYEEQPGGKRRPALVVGAGRQGLLALKITSQDKSQWSAHYAEISTARWRAMNHNGKRSWLQLDRPQLVPWQDVHRPLGLCEPQLLWDSTAHRHRLGRRTENAPRR
ncbi:type II toxin-antitoxin system PemK/MazF family toxin [Kitasatospora sp. GP82]|uniref:type II toxin-antitoxin system PemK/MazF family toxin n=1 Tax=Kitasatospora sp. GP82 TaxID=3035089 RepID=UPI002475163D|nr:type II toxin-antitoxin system PemK/MazF family toxin [Kitasatospora sp. GP82]MDH6124023.1 hypothetical protein [Kitasatospora sp. GP82]